MKYADLESKARDYLGSNQALDVVLPNCLTPKELAVIPEDRYLSAMTKCVFRAGFVWRVIENKWPDFEEAFNEFHPLVIAHYSDEKLEELAQDTRIVRNFTKIKATRDNATMIVDCKRAMGKPFAELIADWPGEDLVGLWLLLKKQGNRLGGNSGPGFLRLIGKDTFMLTNDVITALVNYGFMDKVNPNTKGDLLKVQRVFNEFQQQSGRPMCEISRILAHTVNQR